MLTSPRFCDKSVAQSWATLLDEGVYLASMSTMHRLLRLIGQAGDRRNQASHPPRARLELMATGPGQVWSWDITKLRGPDRGVYYDLYVILDIYSRYVIGWTVAAREDADIAKNLIETAARVHGAPDSLHADRGTSMTSKPVAQLLVDLGVARSHSRPHVSNDNPFSEAHFKTLKYCPAFPGRFGSLADARAFCETFLAYNNFEHRHSGIGLHTPASVHFGTASQIRQQHQATLRMQAVVPRPVSDVARFASSVFCRTRGALAWRQLCTCGCGQSTIEGVGASRPARHQMSVLLAGPLPISLTPRVLPPVASSAAPTDTRSTSSCLSAGNARAASQPGGCSSPRGVSGPTRRRRSHSRRGAGCPTRRPVEPAGSPG